MTGGESESGILRYWSVANLCAWSCILLPCTVYFIFALPHIWDRWPTAMILASLVLFILTVSFLLLACCSDPGVIPRRPLILATGINEELTSYLGYDPLGVGQPVNDRHTDSDNMVPDVLRAQGFRWCHTCQIVRPPRASHCKDCDSCVLRFDHHCPFVNNCVGQRNYFFFIGFTTSVCCLAFLVLPALFWFFAGQQDREKTNDKDKSKPVQWEPLLWALLIVGILVALAALAAAGLWVYHLFLISQGKTTKEHLQRKSLDINSEPTACAPRGPRLFDPRAWVDPQLLEHYITQCGTCAS